MPLPFRGVDFMEIDSLFSPEELLGVLVTMI